MVQFLKVGVEKGKRETGTNGNRRSRRQVEHQHFGHELTVLVGWGTGHRIDLYKVVCKV